MSDRKTAALLALLNEERAALLKGDYVDLDRLSPSKQKMLASLPEHALSESNLKRVAHAIRRNQSLLAAAIDGIRAAQGKMSNLRAQRASFTTYDRSGSQRPVGEAQSVIERKA